MEQQELSSGAYMPHTGSSAYPLRHLSIATVTEPEHICGVAHRIGFTGKDMEALPMYRLMVTEQDHSDRLMLPFFFVLEKGVFVEYEHWCHTIKTGTQREPNEKAVQRN
jgi:hypothetical protein